MSSEEDPNVRHMEPEIDTNTTEDQAKNEEYKPKPAEATEEKDKGLVYAELDLVRSNSPVLVPVVKNADDKTEYAEIVYTPAKNEDESNEKSNEKAI